MPDDHAEPVEDALPIWRPTAEDTENARAALIDLRNRLNADLAAARCEVFFYAKRGRRLEDRYRRLAMTADLATEFKNEFDTAMRRLLVSALDNPDGLRPNSVGEHVEGTVGYLPLGSMGRFGANIAQVPPDGTWEHRFRPDEEAFIEHLRTIYISIAFGEPRERLLIAQAYSVSRVLKKGISAHFIGNEYARLENGSVLTLQPDVHFILWRDNIYLTRLDKFESQTQYREATEAIAAQVWDGIVGTLPFHDVDVLRRNLLAKPIYSKKLSKLGQADYLDQLQLDLIRGQIQEHGLAMRIEEKGDGSKFIILNDPNDPKALMDLLKLLDDDLWKSVLTGIRYAARAKDRR